LLVLLNYAALLLDEYHKDFTNLFYKAIEHEDGATTEVHKLIIGLQPRGILTYNYDYAQENAINAMNVSDCWSILHPDDEEKLTNILKSHLDKPFLLKAHGSLDNKESMILTRDSYRHLLNKCPVYKAFMQNLLTNFNMLIIGFGLSDPDFDLFVQYIFSVYGSPLQDHVVIKHEGDKNPNDVVYHLRYGLNFLYVKDFKHIPKILHDSMTTLGLEIQKLINASVFGETSDERSEAHRKIELLNNNGKRCIAKSLMITIKDMMNKQHTLTFDKMEELSEYIYTIGKLAKYDEHKDVKDFLIEEVIEKCEFSEPIAHALISLREGLREDDLAYINYLSLKVNDKTYKLLEHKDCPNTDPDKRVPIYVNYIRAYLRAKYRIFD
jgi:hypothetical protein